MQFDYGVKERVGSTLPERHSCSPWLQRGGNRHLEERRAGGMDRRHEGGLWWPWPTAVDATMLLITINQKVVCNRLARLSHMVTIGRPKEDCMN